MTMFTIHLSISILNLKVLLTDMLPLKKISPKEVKVEKQILVKCLYSETGQG